MCNATLEPTLLFHSNNTMMTCGTSVVGGADVLETLELPDCVPVSCKLINSLMHYDDLIITLMKAMK